MKKKIVPGLISILLFGLSGCICYDGEMWEIEIVNNLNHSIYAIVVFERDSRFELGPILPGERETEFELHISESPETPHKGFRRISIFSEDEKPFMILQGEIMNEYVIFIGRPNGRDESGAYTFNGGEKGVCVFRLEVEEEYEGIGLDKRIDLEEDIGDDTE